MIEQKWEAAELAGVLTTYIAGIEEVLKSPILEARIYLNGQIDTIYDTLAPIVGEAQAAADVNLPWD